MTAETTPKDDYVFTRTYNDNLRLNANHFIMKGLSGNLLHPKVVLNEPGSSRIADVACGTCIWLTELSDELPRTTRFDGFDLSDRQFPNKGFVPENVQLRTHDCLKPFPEELVGKFDVVNVRFLMCVLNNTTVKTAVSNIKNLLSVGRYALTRPLKEPSGYFQWWEPLAQSSYVTSHNGGLPTPAADRLRDMFRKPTPNAELEWIANLPKIFEEQELGLVACDQYEWTNTYRPLWQQTQISGIQDMAKNSTDPKTKESLFELASTALKEFQGGVCAEAPYQWVVGRVPGA